MARAHRRKGRLRRRAQHSPFTRRVTLPVQQFIHVEETAGGPLLLAAAAAMVWINSPWDGSYDWLFGLEVALEVGEIGLADTLRGWIGHALMTLFFLVVGMEVKHELLRGELASWRKAALPLATGFGGMLVPVAAYMAVVVPLGGPLQGWAVPVATDIAFALAVLAVLGRGVPRALKVLVLAFAAVDDVGGVLIIAVFYAGGPAWPALGLAVALVLLILAMQRAGVQQPGLYVAVGIALWAAVLHSGVHPTIAGVTLGALTPIRPVYPHDEYVRQMETLLSRYRRTLEASGDGDEEGAQSMDEQREAVLGEIEELTRHSESPLDRLTLLLNPWVSYLVLPLFALSHAGVRLDGALDLVSHPAGLGVLAGLVLGKPLGIILAAWGIVRLGAAELPEALGWRHICAMGLLAGIGFTVSLFIATLGFGPGPGLDAVKLAVLAASLLMGLAGGLLLLTARGRG